MSILSSNNAGIKSYIPKLIVKDLVTTGRVYAVETEQSPEDIELSTIAEAHGMTYTSHNSFVKDLVAAAKEEGIPIYGVDCATFHDRNDAIGWLRTLSELPTGPKRPLIVLENITELLPELRNVLLHGWKNDTNQFCDERLGKDGIFTIDNRKYRIYLTWDKSKQDELKAFWHPGDGHSWIGNYEEWKRNCTEMYKKMNNEDFIKILRLRDILK